jgi:hypothetical protein
MLVATLASARATARRSPWWSASAAWIVASSRPPPTPITSTEPMVTSAMRPAANPIVPAPISTADAQRSERRPSARSSRAEIPPATRLVHDDQPWRRLQVSEPGKHHVPDPGEPITRKVHLASFSLPSFSLPSFSHEGSLPNRRTPKLASASSEAHPTRRIARPPGAGTHHT